MDIDDLICWLIEKTHIHRCGDILYGQIDNVEYSLNLAGNFYNPCLRVYLNGNYREYIIKKETKTFLNARVNILEGPHTYNENLKTLQYAYNKEKGL